MLPRFSERERWLALGLLLAALAAAYAVLLHPWWTLPLADANQRIDALQQRELRLRQQLAQAPEVAQRLEALRERQSNGPGFLPEASAELATAALIQRLETVVQQASPGNRSCAITNRSPLEPSTGERYTRVTVQVRLTCGHPELAAVLHSLESGTPRLFVNNLNILVQRMYFPAGAGGATTENGLEVSFDLYGYLLPAAEAARED